MLYHLTCPNCQTVNEVEAEEPGQAWTCSNCAAEPFSSLPTVEVDGEYILLEEQD